MPLNYMWKVLLFLIFIWWSGVLRAEVENCAITNEIRFTKDGAGILDINISATSFEKIVRGFYFEPNTTVNQFRSYLDNDFRNLGFKELSASVRTNGSIYLKCSYGFTNASSIVEWLNDNKLVSGKYIIWSKDAVELKLDFSRQYYYDPEWFIFNFQGYSIVSANGIPIGSNRVVWQMSINSSSLYLKAEKR
jgi:hypothetical protein